MTTSLGKSIRAPLFLSLSDIYIRYPLNAIYNLLNYLTTNNLTFVIPISFSFLSRAIILPSIDLITPFSWLIVTIYKSTNRSPILVSLNEPNDPSIILTATFSGILSILVLP